MKKIIPIIISASIFLSSCSLKSDSARFKEYTDEYFISSVTSNGLALNSYIKYPENFGIEEYPTTLGRYTLTSSEEAKASYQSAIDELKNDFDRSKLTEEQQLIYDILLNDYETALKGADFRLYSEPLNAYSGIQLYLPAYFTEFDITSKKSADQYIALIGDVGNYFDSIIEFEKKKSESGLFMSDDNCEEIVIQCEETARTLPESEIFDTFSSQIDALDISDEEKEAYKSQQKHIIEDTVIPAYKKLASELEKLKGTGTESGAVCNLPNGKEYYEYLFSETTGSDKSLDEIKAMLDEDVEKYGKIYFDIAAEHPELYAAENCGMNFAESEPEEIMNYLLSAMSEDYPEIDNFSANIKYTSAGGNPALYFNAPIDDAGSAVIYIDTEYYGKSLYAAAAHEGIPGHLYQNYYFSLQNVQPIRFLLKSNGHIEGWASYVERESYNYAGNNKQNSIDMITANSIYLLAIITRTDIGVNYDGWNADNVEEYFLEHNISAASAEYYYNLVMKKPTQYLPYYAGWREITDLRNYAVDKLGRRFELKDFHKTILDAGPVPIKLLRPQVDKYIEEILNNQDL